MKTITTRVAAIEAMTLTVASKSLCNCDGVRGDRKTNGELAPAFWIRNRQADEAASDNSTRLMRMALLSFGAIHSVVSSDRQVPLSVDESTSRLHASNRNGTRCKFCGVNKTSALSAKD